MVETAEWQQKMEIWLQFTRASCAEQGYGENETEKLLFKQFAKSPRTPSSSKFKILL